MYQLLNKRKYNTK